MHDLTFLKVTRLIIHELPKRGMSPTDGVLTDTESPLTKEVRHFFEERIREALASKGIPIGITELHSSPVPDCVKKLLCQSHVRFVRESQTIAEHFFCIQTGVHSEGLLCIAECTIKTAAAIAIIKLELEEGVRAELRGTTGQTHFEILVVDDLMLTKNTKVFKVALFSLQDGLKFEDVEARACDSQRARAQLIAEYFLDQFLGCHLLDEPDIMTKKFLETAEVFINTQIKDPVIQARYQNAVLAELNSNSDTVHARAFVDVHMDSTHRKAFLGALGEAEVATTGFGKDVKLIRSKIVRMRFEFDGGISVLVPPQRLNESVTVKQVPDGRTQLAVLARLKKVKGAK